MAYLALMVALIAVGLAVVWFVQRRPLRSHPDSVSEFREHMRALSPRSDREPW